MTNDVIIRALRCFIRDLERRHQLSQAQSRDLMDAKRLLVEMIDNRSAQYERVRLGESE